MDMQPHRDLLGGMHLAFRDKGIKRGFHNRIVSGKIAVGDFSTSEFHVIDENFDHYWEINLDGQDKRIISLLITRFVKFHLSPECPVDKNGIADHQGQTNDHNGQHDPQCPVGGGRIVDAHAVFHVPPV